MHTSPALAITHQAGFPFIYPWTPTSRPFARRIVASPAMGIRMCTDSMRATSSLRSSCSRKARAAFVAQHFSKAVLPHRVFVVSQECTTHCRLRPPARAAFAFFVSPNLLEAYNHELR